MKVKLKLFLYTIFNKFGFEKNDFFADKLKKYETINIKNKYLKNQLKTYDKKIQIIKSKVRKGEKIRVAFFVNILQMFPAKPLFEEMLKNDSFEPFIVIIPDTRFGKEQEQKMLEEAYNELSKEFDNVFLSYDEKAKTYIDFSDKVDIICYASPYNLSREYYNIEHILDKNILPIHINYGFFRSKYDRLIVKEDSYNYFWKVFVETKYNLKEMKKYSPAKAKNAVVIGYGKMDELAKYASAPKGNRKKIIISPHHSVEGGFNKSMTIANFLKYADLFLELPNKYPNIDFVFRPHPALFIALADDKFWGKEKVGEYIEKIKSYKNLIYSTERNYLREFAASDGIIQDCGSFLVEYFYTNKPCCYMLKNKKEIKKNFTKLGVLCLNNCYMAFEENEIIDFIENVIIKGLDTKKEKREIFSKEEIMLNYPDVCKKIAEYIKMELSA